MNVIISVIGKDRIGIIKDVSTFLADLQINIVDISQTLMGEYFTMIMRANTEKSSMPLDKLGKALAEKHPIVKRSAFPKSKKSWYSVIADDSFKAADIFDIIDAAYLQNGGKAAEGGISLKASLAAAKATETKKERSKKGVAEHIASEFGKTAEINCRGNKTKTGLPLADTHYAVEGEKRVCFIYVYDVGTVMFLVRLPEDYAAALAEKHASVKRSAFPKAPNPWYSVIWDDSFTDAEVSEVLKVSHDSVLD